MSLTERFPEGLADYAGRHVRDALIPFVGSPRATRVLTAVRLSWAQLTLSAALLVGVILGLVGSVHRYGILPVHLYLPLYLLVVAVWPWRDARFLYGVVPILFAFAILGGWTVLDRVASAMHGGERLRQGAVVTGIGCLLALAAAQATASLRIARSKDHTWDLAKGFSWVRENTVSDAVIVSELAEIGYLYARRHAVPWSADPTALGETACERATFVVITPRLEWRTDSGLRLSERASQLTDALAAGTPPNTLVYDDTEALVSVYSIQCSAQ